MFTVKYDLSRRAYLDVLHAASIHKVMAYSNPRKGGEQVDRSFYELCCSARCENFFLPKWFHKIPVELKILIAADKNAMVRSLDIGFDFWTMIHMAFVLNGSEAAS